MFGALLVIIVGTLLGAALLTPFVFGALLSVFPGFPWPFSRVFDRVAMALVIVFVIFYRKRFALGALKERLFGARIGDSARAIVLGLFVTLGTSALIIPILLELNILVMGSRSGNAVLLKGLRTVPAALLISVIEESFFRVLLLDALRRVMPVIGAVVCSSMLYSAVHFIAPVKSFTFQRDWTIGFEYLGLIFERMAALELLPAYLGLFLVGLLLCYAIMNTGSLYFVIGLHAGWVLMVKMVGYMTEPGAALPVTSSIGRRYLLVASPVGWLSIFLAFLAVLYTRRMIRGGSRGA